MSTPQHLLNMHHANTAETAKRALIAWAEFSRRPHDPAVWAASERVAANLATRDAENARHGRKKGGVAR